MIRSAHIDTFARDHLPPPQQWPEFLFKLPELHYPDRLNCVTAFVDDWIAVGHGDRDCLISPAERWSYADLAECVNRIANVLTRDLGVVPGNRVLLRGPNSPMMVAAYFAVIKAGGIVVATMPLLRAKEIAFPLTKAEIRLALCDVRLADEMEKARPLAPEARPRRLLGIGRDRQPRSDDDAGGLRAFRRLRHRERRRLPDRLYLGHDRRAQGHHAFPPRHAGDLRHLRQIRAARRSRRPLHRFAADRLHLRARRPGAVSAARRRRDDPAWRRRRRTICCRRSAISRATVCFTAPTAFRAMLGKLADFDLSSLRKCVSAGETLPAATFEAWEAATGIRIIDGLGSTEMLHIFIACREEDMRPGATGKAIPGYEARVIDETGAEVPPGTAGPACGTRPNRLPVSGRQAANRICAERLERDRRHLYQG